MGLPLNISNVYSRTQIWAMYANVYNAMVYHLLVNVAHFTINQASKIETNEEAVQLSMF